MQSKTQALRGLARFLFLYAVSSLSGVAVLLLQRRFAFWTDAEVRFLCLLCRGVAIGAVWRFGNIPLPHPSKKTPLLFLLGSGIGAVLIAVCVLCAKSPLSTGGTVWSALLWAFAYAVQSTSEEFLFRGMLQRSLSDVLGDVWGIFLSGAVFALAHLGNAGITPTAICNLFLLGILFSLVYRKTFSLSLVCGMHTGWNVFLSTFCQTEDPFLTEGSLVCTVLLSAVTVAYLIYIKKSARV